MIGCRTVGNNVACLNLLAEINDRLLVNTCTLVGAHELCEIVSVDTVCSLNFNIVGIDVNYDTVLLTKNNCTGVNRCLILHTGSDDRSLCTEKRNCLSLHV